MGTELDYERVIADYADGRPVAEIEAAYGITRTEIEYLVGGQQAPPVSRWSLQHRGNRIALAFFVGLLIQFFAGLLGAGTGARLLVWAGAAFVTYLLATNYAGRDSSR
jgi:hypothetical protein